MDTAIDPSTTRADLVTAHPDRPVSSNIVEPVASLATATTSATT